MCIWVGVYDRDSHLCWCIYSENLLQLACGIGVSLINDVSARYGWGGEGDVGGLLSKSHVWSASYRTRVILVFLSCVNDNFPWLRFSLDPEICCMVDIAGEFGVILRCEGREW
jgi:hypothetical protein